MLNSRLRKLGDLAVVEDVGVGVGVDFDVDVGVDVGGFDLIDAVVVATAVSVDDGAGSSLALLSRTLAFDRPAIAGLLSVLFLAANIVAVHSIWLYSLPPFFPFDFLVLIISLLLRLLSV